MTGGLQAARLLRERAWSYARDGEKLAHAGNADPGDLAMLRTLVVELRKVADEIEVAA